MAPRRNKPIRTFDGWAMRLKKSRNDGIELYYCIERYRRARCDALYKFDPFSEEFTVVKPHVRHELDPTYSDAQLARQDLKNLANSGTPREVIDMVRNKYSAAATVALGSYEAQRKVIYSARGVKEEATGVMDRGGPISKELEKTEEKTMPKVPWFPSSYWPTKSDNLTQDELYERQLEELHGITTGTLHEKPPRSKRGPYRPRPLVIQKFTPEELAEKRKKAIEEEAAKKVHKELLLQKKQEDRWIELGRAICSLEIDDFILPDSDPSTSEEASGDEVLANVSTFVSNMKRLLGLEAKGTVLGNTLHLTASLCEVNSKSIYYVESRIERTKKLKEVIENRAQNEQDAISDRWIQIGRMVCSLTPEDFGIGVSFNPPESSSSSAKPGASIRSKNSNPNPEFSDDDYIEEDANDGEDFAPPRRRKRARKSKKTLAWRGEDVIGNTFNFASAFKTMLGENSKFTCFRSPYEFTSVFCNVAEKSVRDRHRYKKEDKIFDFRGE